MCEIFLKTECNFLENWVYLWAKYIWFLKKICAWHRASVDEKKNCMRRLRFSIATVVTTVVITITYDCSNDRSNDSSYGKSYDDAYNFFSHYGWPMSGTVFKKKLSFKDNNDAKVHVTLTGAKERRAKNNDKYAFLRIRRCCHDSRNLGHALGPLASS